MPEIDLDALEATARAATPGPWVASDPYPFQPGAQIRLYGRKWTPIRIEEASARHVRPTPDAYYIVAAQPTTVLALIARLREAEACIEAVGDYADDAVHVKGIQTRLRQIISRYKTTKTEGN